MKALVLSGGQGTRLRPFSYSIPKQLIPVAGRPVLEHVLDNITEIGITDIGMIVGDQADEIVTTLGDGSRFGARITYLRQHEPLGLAHCVILAREFLGDDDFAMFLGDNVLPDGVAPFAAEFAAHRPAAQVLVQKVADPTAFGVAELDHDGSVLRLVEKPDLPRTNTALMGVYFFTPAVHRAVRSIRPSARGELEITDAVQWLVTSGAPVRAGEYTGYWRDAGDVDGVLECNGWLLDRLRSQVAGEIDPESELTGQVIVEPGARLLRSRVDGPAIIGAGSVLDGSHIGRYTCIGKGCLLTGSKVDNSIVLDRSSLSGVQGLSHSLIGRGATVGVSEHGAGHHQLVVGDDTRVEFVA